MNAVLFGRDWVYRVLGPCICIVAVLHGGVSHVYACAACACGDPTLTTMGAEQPFAGRLRLALDIQYRTDAVGRPGADRIELDEVRTRAAISYTPERWLTLSLAIPLLGRELTDVTLARERLIAVGDIEAYARAYVFRDREFAPRHLLGVHAGLRVPTGPTLRDAEGRYREPELQPGGGSFDPSAGLTYLLLADPWSLFASEIVYVPTHSATRYRAGPSWRGTHVLQYQVIHQLALRAGVYHRLEAASTHGSIEEPDSGGYIVFAAPAVAWTPATDLVLSFEVQLPIVNALRGRHDEGLFASVGAAYDL